MTLKTILNLLTISVTGLIASFAFKDLQNIALIQSILLIVLTTSLLTIPCLIRSRNKLVREFQEIMVKNSNALNEANTFFLDMHMKRFENHFTMKYKLWNFNLDIQSEKPAPAETPPTT